MSAHRRTRGWVGRLAIAAAVVGLATGMAAAEPCEGTDCETKAQTTPGKPLKLKKFTRKPVANSAVRTVKKKNGEYRKVAIKPRPKPKAEPAPAVTPETLPAAAAQSFASYELARVRVVTPPDDEQPNSVQAGLMTDPTATAANSPIPSAAETVVGVETVQVVSKDQLNDIDRKADTAPAVSLDALSRSLASSADDKPEEGGWLHKMLLMLGGAFAAAAALVRAIFG